ncbi:MAG: TIGR00730 family Rossman fold protein [Rhodoferax sp.]|nr:TIGR00730 family Rossman fold protein [Rhodoferax sp.]MCF8208458.1 TIGR00730 family Rossman fold protein [Rhodoferax sp.]
MTQVKFSLCVYCGSRPGTDPAFAQAAAEVGHWIAKNGGQLVYGGGRGGLMGVVADATLRAGGRVVGVIPTSLVERELAHRGCTELHIVETMHERKRLMAERADAFLALPGGIGTFEELFEVWTWRQLGYHDKPIGILNCRGYYQGLLDFLNASVQHGFLNEAQQNLVVSAETALDLLPILCRSVPSHIAPPLNLI